MYPFSGISILTFFRNIEQLINIDIDILHCRQPDELGRPKSASMLGSRTDQMAMYPFSGISIQTFFRNIEEEKY